MLGSAFQLSPSLATTHLVHDSGAAGTFSDVSKHTGERRMSKAKPITVGTRKFRSLTQAVEHFSKMLNRYEIGEIVTADDTADLMALFEMHPRYNEKIGDSEVVGFDVNKATKGTKCFNARLSDGKRVHFSYKRCLNLKDDDDDCADAAQPDLF
jgi:hypothetical protein